MSRNKRVGIKKGTQPFPWLGAFRLTYQEYYFRSYWHSWQRGFARGLKAPG